ncbi:phosphotransferase family protein [Alphaproteobacteria bacterium]|nr:phosphotransferase family protein [Alphaproteobacteria bacterium]
MISGIGESSAPLHHFAGLSDWLSEQSGATDIIVKAAQKLSGGAIQENWLLSVSVGQVGRWLEAGESQLVLRTDAPSSLSVSHGRREEFALMSVAYDAGVAVPQPFALCTQPDIIGAPFFIMQAMTGEGQGRKLVRHPDRSRFGGALVRQLGVEMARIHTITPSIAALSFLSDVPHGISPARQRIAECRDGLDTLPQGHPVCEYALNWLEDNLAVWEAEERALTLTHRDFRTGNFLVDDGQLTAILDWEFAAWSHPAEDIAWLCARCWRFGNDGDIVGGLAGFDEFAAGYEQLLPDSIDRGALPYWQVMAELRWAVIALHQAERNDSGAETSLELALSGFMAAEMEYNMLALIKEVSSGAGGRAL